MGGNLPFIRPDLNGEVVPNSGLASAQARAPSFESYLPQHPGMYTAIRSAVRGASMQRLIRVEFQLGRPATRR